MNIQQLTFKKKVINMNEKIKGGINNDINVLRGFTNRFIIE